MKNKKELWYTDNEYENEKWRKYWKIQNKFDNKVKNLRKKWKQENPNKTMPNNQYFYDLAQDWIDYTSN